MRGEDRRAFSSRPNAPVAVVSISVFCGAYLVRVIVTVYVESLIAFVLEGRRK